jgi:hypothetical protein
VVDGQAKHPGADRTAAGIVLSYLVSERKRAFLLMTARGEIDVEKKELRLVLLF